MPKGFKQIGKYSITRTIGKGGMGSVYEGFDPDIERKVAIKVLHPHLIDEDRPDEYIARFKREAQSAAKCVHPNIVTILEYGQEDECPYIVMEYVDGQTLDYLIRNKKLKSHKQALQIFVKLLKALSAAHKQGVVHRDLKPANIIIVGSSDVKLTDFGIAHMNQNARLTRVGYCVGTPQYMAPEQGRGEQVDQRADLFSAAVILLEMLTEVKFSGQSSKPDISLITNGGSVGQVDLAQLLLPAFIPIVSAGLAADPKDRFSTAKEMLQALQEATQSSSNRQQAVAGAGPTSVSTAETPVTQTTAITQAQQAREHREYNEMEQSLSTLIGPVAKRIVSRERNQTGDLSQVAMSVSQHIPDEEERSKFLEAWGTRQTPAKMAPVNEVARAKSGKRGISVESINAKTMDELKMDFASYVGPIAKRLISRHFTEDKMVDEALNSLAKEITNEQERETFRSRWNKVLVG